MIVLSNRMFIHTSLPSVIHIGDADVPFVFCVKNLGVTLDSISACHNTHATVIKLHTYKSGTSVPYGTFSPLKQLKPSFALLFSLG